MKQQIFFIHGADSFTKYEDFLNALQIWPITKPYEIRTKGWKDDFAEKLMGTYDIYFPQMPNKQNAKYEEWKIWFERHLEILRDGVILMGHSQGGYFLAKYLVENELPFKVSELYLLAAPIGPDDFDGEDGGDFNFDTSKLPEIVNKVGKIHIFHSKDDPVVPYSHALHYHEALPESELITFEDKNHFLIEELPELVESVRDLSKTA